MKTAAAAISALCLLAPAGAAHACSEFNLVAQQIGETGYNPNSLSPVAMQIELFLLDGPAEQSCASNTVEISSQTTEGVRDLVMGGSVIAGTTPPGQSIFSSYTDKTLRLSPQAVDQLVTAGRLVFDYAWIEPGNFYPAGLYTSLLGIDVNGIEMASVEPDVTVYPAVRLLGEASNGYKKVDFETLQSHEEITTNFVYQSNAKLTVTAHSLNNGALVHEDGVNVCSVPYSAFIDDQKIATNGAQSLNLNTQAGLADSSSIRLRLGDIGAPVAGQYADVLTLNITTD